MSDTPANIYEQAAIRHTEKQKQKESDQKDSTPKKDGGVAA